MAILEALFNRIRSTAVLFIGGLILIIYISLGVVYWQQGSQQEEHTQQMASLMAILAKPLAKIETLQAEREKVNEALAIPKTDSEAIEILLGIARKSGIDTDSAAAKFSVPPAVPGQKNVGGGSYRLLSFKGISVSGSYAAVTAFIADLDAGATLENMVLTSIALGLPEGGGETKATVGVDIYTKP